MAAETPTSDLFVAGRAAWPELVVPDAVFRAYLAARRSRGVGSNADVPAADLYLACACVHGLPLALAAFEDRCLAGVVEALVKQDLPLEVAQDAVQNVRQKLLCPPPGEVSRIDGYQGAGSLAGWV